MDVLKSARRIIRSPTATKQQWSAGKHQKLPENWTDSRETLADGVTFNLRHFGMTLVDQPKGEDLTAAAVKRIIATAKAGGGKLPKVTLRVSSQGLLLYDSESNELLDSISIHRISYCTADKTHDKVFAYIAQNQQNETLECRAFLCAKRKVAQAVTLTVAQAFKLAFESWQLNQQETEQEVSSSSGSETRNSTQLDMAFSLVSLEDAVLGVEGQSSVLENQVKSRTDPAKNKATLEGDDGLDEAFSSCRLDSFEYSDLPSPVQTLRFWTFG